MTGGGDEPRPKFCINCKHIGRNGSNDWTRFRCFAPQNILSIKSNLVTGQSIKQVRHESCEMARFDYDGVTQCCGEAAKWFEPVPPPEIISASKSPTEPKSSAKPNAGDLLGMLDSMK